MEIFATHVMAFSGGFMSVFPLPEPWNNGEGFGSRVAKVQSIGPQTAWCSSLVRKSARNVWVSSVGPQDSYGVTHWSARLCLRHQGYKAAAGIKVQWVGAQNIEGAANWSASHPVTEE